MKVSRHAEVRLRERSGLNKKSVARIAERAYRKGYRHGQTKGNLKKWIDEVYFNGNNRANEMRVYGDKLFLFRDGLLITVLQIPASLCRNLSGYIREDFDGKKD